MFEDCFSLDDTAVTEHFCCVPKRAPFTKKKNSKPAKENYVELLK